MESVVETLPDGLRAPVERWLEHYDDGTHVRELARLVACSEFAGRVVLREKAWFLDNVGSFATPPRPGT